MQDSAGKAVPGNNWHSFDVLLVCIRGSQKSIHGLYMVFMHSFCTGLGILARALIGRATFMSVHDFHVRKEQMGTVFHYTEFLYQSSEKVFGQKEKDQLLKAFVPFKYRYFDIQKASNLSEGFQNEVQRKHPVLSVEAEDMKLDRNRVRKERAYMEPSPVQELCINWHTQFLYRFLTTPIVFKMLSVMVMSPGVVHEENGAAIIRTRTVSDVWYG